MTIRTTPKMIVKRFSDYCTNGAADVYYSQDDFAKTAAHYGWGSGRLPTEMVTHQGDEVPLLSVFYSCLKPVRVRYI